MTHDRGMLRSLRNRNYRLYAGGQLLAQTGAWMQRIAQDWLVLQLTNSGIKLGFVIATQFVPWILLALWGGTVADRGNKRRILFVTQGSLGLTALTLALLDLTGVVAYWQVLVLAGALGVVSAVDTPVRQAFVVELVGQADLVNAVGINSTIFNSARLIGPAAAGVAIAVVGTGWAFAANAASSVVVLFLLALMRPGDLHPSPPVPRKRGQQREALVYLRGRPDLILGLSLILAAGTFGPTTQVSVALLAKQVFDRGAAGYGLLSSALACGALLGAVFATRRRTQPSLSFVVAISFMFSLLQIAAGAMPTFASTAVALVPAGLTMLLLTNAVITMVQLGVRPTLRGRLMAVFIICSSGGAPIGAPLMGWLASRAGPRWAMIGGGLICLLVTVALGARAARRGELRGNRGGVRYEQSGQPSRRPPSQPRNGEGETMNRYPVGSSGLIASQQCFGAMGMSISYGPADDDESVRTLHRAAELGITMFDTAEVYGPFRNERLLARAFGDRRDQVTIATKFGTELDDDGRKLGPVNGSPEYVRKAAARSLRNLSTDVIDLYYLHRPDPRVPIEETIGAMAELVAAGQVRYLGVSNATADEIRRAHATHPLTAVQVEYSLFTRDVEANGVLAAARALGIGVVPYSPVGRGVLTGEIRSLEPLPATDFRRIVPRFQGENLTSNLAVVDRLRALAERREITAAQLALAWLHAQGHDIFPIPGTRYIAHLEQNTAAAAVELTPGELDEIDQVAPAGVAAGDPSADPALMMKR